MPVNGFGRIQVAAASDSASRVRVYGLCVAAKSLAVDWLREGAYPEQEFRVVVATEVGTFLEMLGIGQLGAEITGKRAKQCPGRLVIFSNRRFHVCDVLTHITGHDGFEHSFCKALASSVFVDGNLPDENRLGLLRGNITGDKADQVTVLFSGNTGFGEVAALQQVAVDRVGIQWWALFYQLVKPEAIILARCAKGDGGGI